MNRHCRVVLVRSHHIPLFLSLAVFSTSLCLAQPTTVSYQGELLKDGVPFNGTAQFKFALVAPGGTPTLWSNDNTSVNGSEPTTAVSVSVSDGVFSVLLGAAPMTPLDAAALNTVNDASLRAWVNTGSGSEQLTDQPVSSSPFSLHAEGADGAPGDFLAPNGLIASGDGIATVGPPACTESRLITDDASGVIAIGRVPFPLTAGANKCSNTVFSTVRVGIGTATPTRTIDVNGTALIRGGDFLLDSVTNPGRTYRIISSGRQDISATNDLVTSSGGNTLFVVGTNRGFLIDYQAEGNRKFVLDGPTGNVGIGTTAPARRLEVNGRVRVTNPGVNLPTGGTLSVTVDAAGDLFSQPIPTGLTLPYAGTSGTLAASGACCQSAVFEIQSTGSGASAGPAIAGCVNTGLGGTPGVLGCGQSPGTVGVKGDGNNGNGGIGVWGDVGYGIGVQGIANGSIPASVTPVGVYGKTLDPGDPGNINFNGGIGVKGEEPASSANDCSEAWAGYFVGDVVVTGDLCVNGLKSFRIDHPLDPENKYLVHSCVESDEMMNIYKGRVTTDEQGNAWVDLPDYFEALNGDVEYHLTVIGQFAQAIIAEEVQNNRFAIRTDKPNVKVSWQVMGVRQDAAARAHPMQVEIPKQDAVRGLIPHALENDPISTEG